MGKRKIISIWYWNGNENHRDYLLGIKIPTQNEFETDYVEILTFPLYGDVEENTILEEIFADFNMDEHPFVKYPLPNNCHHTSMSVGDIVQIDSNYYICQSSGWKLIDF